MKLHYSKEEMTRFWRNLLIWAVIISLISCGVGWALHFYLG